MDECRRVRFHGAADGRRFRAGAWHNARHASADRLAVDETGFGGSAARTAEALLRGRSLDDDTLAAVAETAMQESTPISNVRASAAYRREMVGVLTRRAIGMAMGGIQ